MTEHTANIKIDPREIPYRIYCDYLVHIMFPNVDKRKILNNLQVLIPILTPSSSFGVSLVKNQNFLAGKNG